MADFAVVLKNTLDKMGDTTPEVRAKVYEKARDTVRRQIDVMDKAPPQAAVERQFAKLEDAIVDVEAEYATADEILDDVSSDAHETLDEEPQSAEPEQSDAVEGETESLDDADIPAEGTSEASGQENEPETIADTDKAEPEAAVEPEAEMPPVDIDPLAEFLKNQELSVAESGASVDAAIEDLKSAATEKSDDVLGQITPGSEGSLASGDDKVDAAVAAVSAAVTSSENEPTKRGGGRFVWLVVLAGILGGGGYYGYQNQDQLKAVWSDTIMPWWQDLTMGGTEDEPSATQETADENGVPVRTVTTTTVDNNGDADSDTPVAPETTENVVEDVNGAEAPTKFTQRLTEDGTEVDNGPAQGADTTTDTGEGSSVAEQTAGTAGGPTIANPDDAPDTTPQDPVAETAEVEPTQTTEPTITTPVGQRAIFYEERTGSQEGTALSGATVWSVANESPGGDLPVEPAIRAETSIPELGIEMEMTIRRNGDATFPASHIIELFFRVPDTFEGRGIADVQRVTFKTNEQDPGNALIAVPAPIDQNIFLIALTDAATAVSTNEQLMKRENWIDIPMQYTSGRRALITFEKGIPGERVFNEVFAAWEAAPIN